jgi:hypothetical protein
MANDIDALLQENRERPPEAINIGRAISGEGCSLRLKSRTSYTTYKG